jgi:predicted DNA-binding transcriptional regulator AlpA
MSIDLFGIKIDDPLLRPPKVAEMLGVKPQTLSFWRHSKNKGRPAPDLPWVTVGRRSIRYRLSVVNRFIDRNRHGDAEQAGTDSV